jgi:protein-S-isoprenylcysteine O-methyltransferase Ste14
MNLDHPLLREAAVSASGLLYWAGVFVQARRVRRQIGRSPNLIPRGFKETVLWLGWVFVAGGWIGQPFLLSARAAWPGLQPCPELSLFGLWLGLALLLAGYAGTLWCYAAMGDTWRIGVNRDEQNALVTRGPYARVRHPIYLFQIVMLAGVLCLLPTFVSLALLVIHSLCALTKALDEEAHQLRVHGAAYAEYVARTGRFFPKLMPPPTRG